MHLKCSNSLRRMIMCKKWGLLQVLQEIYCYIESRDVQEGRTIYCDIYGMIDTSEASADGCKWGISAAVVVVAVAVVGEGGGVNLKALQDSLPNSTSPNCADHLVLDIIGAAGINDS
jgi:hypothetical protein